MIKKKLQTVENEKIHSRVTFFAILTAVKRSQWFSQSLLFMNIVRNLSFIHYLRLISKNDKKKVEESRKWKN